MKILYIDYKSPNGHVQFNRMHLNALKHIGDIYTVFKENYFEEIQCDGVKKLFDIPIYKYKRKHGRFWSRFEEFQLLRYIKKLINPDDWDYIIISSYDVISMYFAVFFKNIIVIDHTIEGMDNGIKRFFFKNLNKNFLHVVFNESMEQKLIENNVKNVAVVPHGFTAMDTQNSSSHVLERLNIIGNYIFLPSPTSVSTDEIQTLISDERIINCLEVNNLKLVLRGNYISKSPYVIVQKDFFKADEYRDLFLNATCIFLPYRSTFKYRVSGVFFECVANNKYCICSDIPALRFYDKYFNYPNHFYANIDEMIQCIEYIISKGELSNKYKDIHKLESPYQGWRNILK